MSINKDALDKIQELNEKYKDTWGKEVDYTIIPKGITQEKLVECLELMTSENISLIVAYNKIFKH